MNALQLRKLTPDEKVEIFKACGLGDLSYRIVEVCGQLVLRSRKVEGLKTQPELEPKRIESPSLQAETPTVVLHFSKGKLPIRSEKSRAGLWSQLFPEPFCLLSILSQRVADTEVVVEPAGFKAELQQLAEALLLFEQKISRYEYTVLAVGEGKKIPVVFHYRRHQCQSVLTDPALEEVVNELGDRPTLSEALHRIFGAPTPYLPLDRAATEGGLVGLTTALTHLKRDFP